MKEEKMSVKEWNENILPKVDSGELKNISSELPKGFLLAYQSMEGLVLDVSTGKKYRCVGWLPPKGTPYVEIKLWTH